MRSLLNQTSHGWRAKWAFHITVMAYVKAAKRSKFMKIKDYLKQLFKDYKICGFNIRRVIRRRNDRRKKHEAIVKLRKDMEKKEFNFINEGKVFEALMCRYLTECQIIFIAAQPLVSRLDYGGVVVPVNRRDGV